MVRRQVQVSRTPFELAIYQAVAIAACGSAGARRRPNSEPSVDGAPTRIRCKARQSSLTGILDTRACTFDSCLPANKCSSNLKQCGKGSQHQQRRITCWVAGGVEGRPAGEPLVVGRREQLVAVEDAVGARQEAQRLVTAGKGEKGDVICSNLTDVC